MTSTRLAALLIWTLLGAGCAGLMPRSDAVKVTVSDIQVVEATLLEQVYRLTVRVQNRTDRELALEGGHFDLELNGRDFGSGVSNQKVVVPAYSDAKIEVRMVSTVFGWVRLIQGLQQREGEPLQYEISGHFSVGGFSGVSFSDSGEIELPAARAGPDQAMQ